LIKTGTNFLIRRLPDFCLILYLLAATFGAFTGGLWASLGIGLALGAFAAVWRIEGRVPLPETEILVFVLFVLWAFAILNFQSSQPALSWRAWGQLASIFLPLSLLASPAIQRHTASVRLFNLLPITLALGALVLGVELVLQGPLLQSVRGPEAGLFQYNRGFSYLVILAFPAMAGLWMTKRRLAIIPLALILLVPASLTESRAAKLALVVGLLTVPAVYLLPALTRRVLAVVPFLAVGWPFAAQKLFFAHHDWIEKLPPSWQDRMEIWDYMSYRILERPLLGWGLGSSATLSFVTPHSALYRYEQVAASHPHNAMIQVWVELGLPGLVCGIAFALLMLRRIGRLPPPIAAFATGAWVAAFCLAMIAYNLWSDSFWAAMALTGFAFALLQKQTQRTDAQS
jgi:O-antigen ligase